MGMMEQMTAPPQQSQPVGMMNTPNPQLQVGGKFNGEINVNGKQIPVINGVLEGSIPGHMVYVAADGGVVFDDKGQILGSLDANNTLQKPTPELIEGLTKAGLTQNAGRN